MQIDITQFVAALAGLLAVTLTVIAIPWIKARISAQRFSLLKQIAQVAVRAAEQMIQGQETGNAKLAYAIDAVQNALKQHGVIYDEETVRTAIEAAVLTISAPQSTSTA